MAKTNLVKNTLLLSFCTLLNKGLMFIMIPLFSRWLTVDSYGTFDLLQTYVFLLIPVITLATSNGVFRLSLDSDDLSYKSRYISNGAVIVFINLLIAIAIIFIVNIFNHFSFIFPFIFLVSSQVIDSFFQGFLRAVKKLNIYALCQTFNVVFTAIITTLLVLILNMGLSGILLGYAFGCFISDAIIFFYVKFWHYFNLKYLSLKKIKELICYSAPLVPNDISWWIINVFDRTLINIFLGSVANGIYAIAGKIPNFCSSVFGVFNISWQEAATDVANDSEKEKYFNSVYNTMLRLLFSVCALIIAFNFIFFDFIFDSRYYQGRYYAPILVIGISFNLLSQFFGGIQISQKNPKANGVTTVCGALISIIFLLVFIRFAGLFAAAFSAVLANFSVFCMRRFLLKKMFVFKVDKKTYPVFFILIISFFLSYFDFSFVFNCIVLICIILFSVLYNKSFIFRFLKK